VSSLADAPAGIRVRDLTKTFWVARHRRGALGSLRGLVDRSGREVQAVAGISFDLAPGEIVGYVGPNGAGKSTTIKMLTGILVPSAGEATVAGLTPWRERKALARRIGVVFGQRTQLWWDLPLIESLDLLRHVYGVSAARHGENMRELRTLLDLDPFLETPVRQLSLGQRMRGDLAAALLHDPAILYLDEPTIGLDVVAKARVREFLQRINRERGVTIILTTHDLADVEHLCRRMIIIDHGRLIYDGGIEEIRRRFGTHRTLIVDLEAGDADAPDDSQCLVPPEMIDDDRVTMIRSDGPRYWLRFDRDRVNPAELIAAVASAHEVRDVAIEEPAIEDIVRRIYEEGVAALTPPAEGQSPPEVPTSNLARS
jgi:ABC-2 type transport system ATP-binding protein